jgi:dihydroorotate dehydrogenase (NAD+) catalytic subunit
MIDLAPGHKTGLSLRNPVMVAAGCYGLGGEYRGVVDVGSLGAVVVGPVTAGPRDGSQPPRILRFSGGILLSTALANPGVSRTIRDHRDSWASAGAPTIVHVPATTCHAVHHCVSRLAALEEVAGLELGLPDPGSVDAATDLVYAALDAAAQPVIVRVPLEKAACLATPIERCGVSALTVAGPPRGTLHDGTTGRFVSGRLYGPFVLPLVLRAVRAVSERVRIPIIGSGGVWNVDAARTLMRAGCAAIQVDGAIWRDPNLPSRIALALEG